MLHDGLAAAERAGDGCRAALGDGEHGVDDALSGVQRTAGGEFAGVRALDTHRPALDHIQLDLAAVAERQAGDLFLDGEFAAADPLHGALLDRRGDHDLVEDGGRLLHGAEHVAGDELIALLRRRDEVPDLLAVERRNAHAAGDRLAGEIADLRQGTLDAVIDIFEHAGPELHAQRHTGRHDLGAGAKAGGLFVDLNGGAASGHIQYLADQVLFADTDNVRYVGVLQTVGHHQRSGYFNHFSAQCSTFFPLRFRRGAAAARRAACGAKGSSL